MNIVFAGQLQEQYRGKSSDRLISLLVKAAETNNLEDMSRLIAAGADVNGVEQKHHWTPLLIAISNNNIEAVHYLLQNGVDVNFGSDLDETPLMYAIPFYANSYQVETKGFSIELIKLLLEYNPDLTFLSYRNDTVIDIAHYYLGNQHQVSRLLHDHVAKDNSFDRRVFFNRYIKSLFICCR
jgi:ankyrin repeat protein